MDVQKILAITVGVILLVVVFVNREKIIKFVSEVLVELKKVSWPTRKELIDSTFIVLISSVTLGVLIGVTDFALSKFLSILIK